MPKVLDWLKYYRASLIDGNRGEKSNVFPEVLIRNYSHISSLTKEEVVKIWDNEKIFKFNFSSQRLPVKIDNEKAYDDFLLGIENSDKDEEELVLTEVNKIEIAPLYITSVVEHGGKIADTKLHYPFWIPAYVDKYGNLYPPKEGELPLFVRNYLTPNPSNLPTVASMEVLDEKMSNRDFKKNNWKQYWNDCEHFFKEVTGKAFTYYQDNEYHQFTLSRLEESNTTRNILALYNELIFSKNAKKQNYSLLNKILDESVEFQNHKLDKVSIFLNSNHFGQMNGVFPLSLSQREAFAQFTSEYNKQAFAINGPPGTGKTTILQSFIANIITQSVLERKPAPLIVGCSTNNQAITNILDSMNLEETDELLPSRWLPNVKSFGLYLASSSKKNEASKKYQIASTSFLNDGFIRDLDDTSKLEDYEDFFLDKLKSLFKADMVLENLDVKGFLFEKIEKLKSTIQNTLRVALKKYETTEILRVKGFSSYANLVLAIEINEKKIKENILRQNLLKQTQKSLIERNRIIPFYVKLLPFKSFKRIRENAYKLVVEPFFEEYPSDYKF
ncbi:AAA domain-containing protein, partial [Tenacibaculum maritimum]|uniref:AAA domain-containing protein n=1 Tax=Tenacibaculum maritimum TaxID=107401 RepID=UPI003875F84E